MKKVVTLTVAIMCVAAMFAAPWSKKAKGKKAEASGYTFGEEKTFRSEKPVTYSISFSDAAWYAMQDTWKTEGIFKDIENVTNVHLDITSYDSGDYEQKINLAINAGKPTYIIPKVYTEDKYVAGGGVVAVSDYVQYMPNFLAFVKKYNMEPDLATITQSDGKFYRLPGMHEAALQDYTLMVREDIFKAAGYDIRELEKTWTWESLLDVLLGVKKYMVSQGMCKESDYIWSDLWCGEGVVNGGNLLKLMGASYNVLSGWAIDGSNGGIKYDYKKKEFYSSSISEDFKKFITVANSFIKAGILDPETFTQSNDTAHNKFYSGKTVIMSTNRSMMSNDIAGVQKILGDKAKCYVTAYPSGTNKNLAETSRLECGVMISQRALDELGEKEFIKLMRFVDWMFYSKEAYTLCKWGPQGKTWDYATVNGKQVKKLLPGFKCGGLGLSGSDDDVDIRLKWGYAGGNYFYGHSTAESTDAFTPEVQDLYARYAKYKTVAVVDPKAKPSEDEREQLNLWATPLTDNINAWTLKFVTGQKDINKDWNEYVSSCKNLNIDKIVKLTNDIYKKQNK
ncbi:putative aldouronate transport system substrate-binding protein [Treponema bryantii]|uniref:Putative aldouronate transport system substrate-binding protein n=1 Tax=Treponema bryantii TaxID=163 RepID=A0A1I3M9X6_9SPIR|nr:extracellular solute-binding protein [Treponema bryantii]SFI93630.1 putative aldouronate transport system substrate-binding protein [Treponema bryantii]